MKIIDLHCDTLSKMFYNNITNFQDNDLHIDLTKLKNGGSFIQTFALFDKKDKTNYDIEKFKKLIDFSLNILKENNVNIIKNLSDIKNDEQNAILSIEDLGSAKSLDIIEYYYNKGFRIMGITWNYENSLGYPNTSKENKGLKKYGKEAVEFMIYKHIAIDVSHLNDRGFFDVADMVKGPFFATHSNARELLYHTRNLTDEMIKTIADHGGIIGINFFSKFLDGSDFSKNEDIIKHIKHIKNKGGIDVLAFGSDFDGIKCELEIKDFSNMNDIINLLTKNDFSEEEVEKMCYKNVLRAFNDIF